MQGGGRRKADVEWDTEEEEAARYGQKAMEQRRVACSGTVGGCSSGRG